MAMMAVALLAPTCFAQKKVPGLESGAVAPEFKLKDQEGKDVSLAPLLKKGKVAIVFYRSANW